MKKAFALILTLALIATLTVASFAAVIPNETKTATSDLTATYIPGSEAATVYSVDVSWNGDNMVFEYFEGDQGAWNPETHEYEAPTNARWTKDELIVTVTNHSNVAVDASISVDDVGGDGVTVYADGEKTATLAAGVVGDFDNADSFEFSVKVMGVPSKDLHEARLASATVSFAPVA